MSAADVALCNEALRMLGEFGITAFDEGTDQAQTLNLIYDSTRRFLLTAHPWRFTLAKQRLARLAETPVSEWTFIHALPAGMLALRALFPTGAAGAAPVREFEIYGPPFFRALARTAMAAECAMAVGAGMSAADLLHRRAFGSPFEMMNGGLMGVARRLDSQQQPPQALRDFPLITARFGRG
jgi:hypothetical protein